MKFTELGLSEDILKAIDEKGFEEPTPIQAETIPLMLKNTHNIIARAQTGTGKTAAFGLPLLDLLEPGRDSVSALILTPTRELAIQVSEEINSLKGNRKLSIVPIYGGQSITQQLARLKRGVDIVVGTPGRILDHLRRKTLKIDNIEHLILDEADEMLNMGFIEDMEAIMDYTGPEKKTLLFSATIPDRIKSLADKYMDGHIFVEDNTDKLATDLTEQIYFEVRHSDKFEALCRIIDIEDEFYGLIFCRTKRNVDDLVNHLLDRGYDAEAIHGDISQLQRERTLEKFKKQRANILVATDVAARGIDVYNLTHVINFSLPQNSESYVHRIGRTGRAGNQGTAITFITPHEYKRLLSIQRFSGSDIKRSTLPKVDDIIKARKRKIKDDLLGLIVDKVDDRFYKWAKSLLKNIHPTEIVAALLAYSFSEELDPGSYGDIKEYTGKERRVEQSGKVRLFVAKGKKDKMDPKKLIAFIRERVDIEPRQIKDIAILDNFSFMTVPFELAEEIIHSFHKKGKKPLITEAKKKKK